ncbi:ribosome silencing factor [Desulfurobacterium sp.]
METVEKLKTALKAASDKKAEEPAILDLRELSTLTDFFLIVSSSSDIHGRTIADEITKKLKEKGVLPINVEGYDSGNWILIDYGDMIVHIFRPETRELYGLENLWIDAPRIESAELLK